MALALLSLIVALLWSISPQNPVRGRARAQYVPVTSQTFPLLPMNSHGIPFVSKDETVKKREGQRKTPNKGEKTGSYRQPLSSDETTEIRRASEQTSPPGGKRVGRPAMGQWRIG